MTRRSFETSLLYLLKGVFYSKEKRTVQFRGCKRVGLIVSLKKMSFTVNKMGKETPHSPLNCLLHFKNNNKGHFI